MKKVILLTALSAATLLANAQDTIQLTWQGGTNKLLRIIYPGWAYPFYYPISVNWGDGSITDTIPYKPFCSGFVFFEGRWKGV
jgi:hypothetical protein